MMASRVKQQVNLGPWALGLGASESSSRRVGGSIGIRCHHTVFQYASSSRDMNEGRNEVKILLTYRERTNDRQTDCGSQSIICCLILLCVILFVRKCENFHGFRDKLRPFRSPVLTRHSLKKFEPQETPSSTY
jgi:hypothetical protein